MPVSHPGGTAARLLLIPMAADDDDDIPADELTGATDDGATTDELEGASDEDETAISDVAVLEGGCRDVAALDGACSLEDGMSDEGACADDGSDDDVADDVALEVAAELEEPGREDDGGAALDDPMTDAEVPELTGAVSDDAVPIEPGPRDEDGAVSIPLLDSTALPELLDPELLPEEFAVQPAPTTAMNKTALERRISHQGSGVRRAYQSATTIKSRVANSGPVSPE